MEIVLISFDGLIAVQKADREARIDAAVREALSRGFYPFPSFMCLVRYCFRYPKC
jgi:hypothetical protein